MNTSQHKTKSSAQEANRERAWFGFRQVDPAEKTRMVREVFASVAGKYDIMNDLMSLGIHRLWKDRFVAMVNPRPDQTILDLAGGTGDIAQRLARRADRKARIIVCDINPAMMEQGKARAIDNGLMGAIEWIAGDAAAIPLPDCTVDRVTIAFGLRNVTLIDTALREAARVLKPGGKFFCLEFSPGVAPFLKRAYDAYSFTILPWLGDIVAKDRASYQYLAESIRQFPDQPTLARRMEQAGMERVRWINLSGGIAAMHIGWKL